MNKLKEKLSKGEVCFGTHISLNDPSITELIGNIGFDYLWIDTEHSSIGLNCLQQHLIAARAAGVSAIVRVPCVDQVRVKPVLEMGPDGIIFPQANSYELAKIALEACMYPPKGNRGFGPRRAIQFGRVPLDEYYRTIDAELMRILQIENIHAVEDIQKMATLEGVDAFIIGPCDLAASMGYFNHLRHPDVIAAIKHVEQVVHAAGIPLGVSYGACTYEDIEFWRDIGVDMISLAADTDHLLHGAQHYFNDMNRCFQKKRNNGR